MTLESFIRRWSRRALTYSSVFVGLILFVITLPVWLPITLLIDMSRGTSWSTTRAFFFVGMFLAVQWFGLAYCLAIWIVCGIPTKANKRRMLTGMFWIENAWATAMGRGAIFIWGLRINLEFDYEFTDRPVILFIRHASIVDTLIPIVFVSAPMKLRYRYVMKKELEWDPCLDTAVNRMPHLFVQRGSDDSQKEVDAIGRMVSDVGPEEGVVIFPEGTRFSEAKRERILRKLEESGQDEMLAWARKYQRVLPPRMGGPMALLENNPGADVVFCVHTGLEKSSSFRESFNGGLAGSPVNIRFWGVPFDEIPVGEQERRDWLLAEWKKADDFVIDHTPDSD